MLSRPSSICRLIALGSVCSLVVMLWTTTASADWPQFRGPNCSGISTSAKPLPESASTVTSKAASPGLLAPFPQASMSNCSPAVYRDILEFSARVLATDGTEFLNGPTGPTISKYVGRVHLDTGRSLGWLRTAGHSPDRRW